MYNEPNLDKVNHVYRVNPRVVIENFDEGALVLHLDNRHLFELNPGACVLLAHTDGVRTVGEVAAIVAGADNLAIQGASSDVSGLYEQLFAQDVVRLVDFTKTERRLLTMAENLTPSTAYLQNPEVTLREEDEDGGLLFNPDTNQIKVVNVTGLFIWKQFEKQQGLDVVATALHEMYDDVSYDDLMADAQAFLDEMVQSGFIGVVESENK